jgi:hypothetical protein
VTEDAPVVLRMRCGACAHAWAAVLPADAPPPADCTACGAPEAATEDPEDA